MGDSKQLEQCEQKNGGPGIHQAGLRWVNESSWKGPRGNETRSSGVGLGDSSPEHRPELGFRFYR